MDWTRDLKVGSQRSYQLYYLAYTNVAQSLAWIKHTNRTGEWNFTEDFGSKHQPPSLAPLSPIQVHLLKWGWHVKNIAAHAQVLARDVHWQISTIAPWNSYLIYSWSKPESVIFFTKKYIFYLSKSYPAILLYIFIYISDLVCFYCFSVVFGFVLHGKINETSAQRVSQSLRVGHSGSWGVFVRPCATMCVRLVWPCVTLHDCA